MIDALLSAIELDLQHAGILTFRAFPSAPVPPASPFCVVLAKTAFDAPIISGQAAALPFTIHLELRVHAKPFQPVQPLQDACLDCLLHTLQRVGISPASVSASAPSSVDAVNRVSASIFSSIHGFRKDGD